jgi:hypothetical protein
MGATGEARASKDFIEEKLIPVLKLEDPCKSQ